MQDDPIELRARARRWRVMAQYIFDEEAARAVKEAAQALDERALEIERRAEP